MSIVLKCGHKESIIGWFISQLSQIPYSIKMERDSVVLMPYNYITKLSGKNFWLKTATAFNSWIQTPSDKFQVIVDAITLLHNASLIIDDIEDRSVMRRGSKSAHEVFGVPMALNSANYVYFLALDRLQSLQNFKIIEIFTENMILLHEGQGCDISYRDNFVWSDLHKDAMKLFKSCAGKVSQDVMNNNGNDTEFLWPSQAEYEKVMAKKTSGLVKMTIEMLYQFKGTELEEMQHFSTLADRLGLCFQMWDDLMNITSQRFTDAKGFAADLDEGTFTFPIIEGLNNDVVRDELLKMLQKREKTREDKEAIIELLTKCGAIEQTRKRVLELIAEIRTICEKFGENQLMDDFMGQFFVNTL